VKPKRETKKKKGKSTQLELISRKHAGNSGGRRRRKRRKKRRGSNIDDTALRVAEQVSVSPAPCTSSPSKHEGQRELPIGGRGGYFFFLNPASVLTCRGSLTRGDVRQLKLTVDGNTQEKKKKGERFCFGILSPSRT